MIIIKKAGRKPQISYDQALEIVNTYISERRIIRYIKYNDIHNFCNELFLKGELGSSPEISFWRKKNRIGGKVIEEINLLLTNELNNETKENNRLNLIRILNDAEVDDSIVKIIDRETKHTMDVVKEQDDKIEKMITEINDLKSKNNILTLSNKSLETLTIQIYQYIFENYPEHSFNVVNTAMNNIFSDPLSFLVNNKKEKVKKDNVISNHFLNKLK